VEHTQIHPAVKKGTNFFHYTSNSCGIFCDFIFHETKIPTMDMKVQVYSKFSKN
jgi:transcription elongation factor Elf1